MPARAQKMPDTTTRIAAATAEGARSGHGSTLAVLSISVSLTAAIACAPPEPAHSPPPPLPTGGEEARAWWRLGQLDERGEIAPGAYRRALVERSRLVRRGDALVAGIAPGHWQSRGPHNVGGRTRALLVDPRNPQRMWAGAVTGGLWRTSDGGESWTPVDDFLGTLAVRTLVMDPGDPDRMWAGTGEVVRGRGIVHSDDGGETWRELPSTTAWTEVFRLAVHPSDGATLLAGVGSGNEPGGIYRTTDAWQSRQLVHRAHLGTSVAFHPLDPSRAIGAIVDFDFDHGDWYWAIVRSTDGGRTWEESPTPGRFYGFHRWIEVAWAPSDRDVAYAQLPGPAGSDPPLARFYRSTNGGRTFVERSSRDTGAGSWMNTVWVSPSNPDHVIMGAINLYRSTDGGATFTGPINGGARVSEPPEDGGSLSAVPPGGDKAAAVLDPFGHVDHHAVIPMPDWNGASRRGALVVNDGGVYRTDDLLTVNGDSGWESLNRTYQTTQFYSLAGTRDFLVGGTQDNGTLRVDDGSLEAHQVLTGDGGLVVIDPRNPDRQYGEYIFLQLFRTFDGGDSVEYETYVHLPDAGDPDRANFIAPIALDPTDPRRLYAGGLSVWRTDSAWRAAKPTWSEVRRPGSAERPSDRLISALSPSPDRAGELWVAQNGGQVFRTDDALAGSPSWETVDDNAGLDPLPDRLPTRIVHGRHDGSVYVTFGGFEPDNLWRTRDQGRTWERLGASSGAPLPAAPIRALVEHPVFPGWLYVGTEVGVFASSDGGRTWSTAADGPASVSVTDLVFLDGTTTLAAATHGRGLWSIDTPGSDCLGLDRALCLSSAAFDVRVAWRDASGGRGAGEAVRLTGDTGYYWFFGRDNVELVLKVLDACSFAGHYWVFAGGLTNVEVDIEVTEVTSGRTRRYRNPLGKQFQPIQDTAAFSCGAAGRSPAKVRFVGGPSGQLEADHAGIPERLVGRGKGGACGGDPDSLCLGDRFRVDATFQPAGGSLGTAHPVPLTSDTGFFWFFDSSNVEMVVKVLDACTFADRFWVFAGGLSDVEIELTVTDTATGARRIYRNPPSTPFQPIQDTSAFATCP